MTSTQTNVHFGADESARVELGCALPGWEYGNRDRVTVHVDGGRLTLFASPEQLEELAGSLLEVAAESRETLAEAFRDEWGPRIARAGCVPAWRGVVPYLRLIEGAAPVVDLMAALERSLDVALGREPAESLSERIARALA